MKFSELKVGDKFKLKECDTHIYIKIDPVEDKYGNYFVALQLNGWAQDTEDIVDSDEVIMFEDLPPMEEQCKECNGSGSHNPKSNKGCKNCHGHGKLLTQRGEALIQFVEEWCDTFRYSRYETTK